MNSNHFSVVSLGTSSSPAAGIEDEVGWSSKRDSRRDTITTNGGARSSVAEPAQNGDQSSSNYDFLLARLETQNKRLSGDPKQMRASIDGAVKLREHFEKLRDGKERHSRSESQNRALPTADTPQPSAETISASQPSPPPRTQPTPALPPTNYPTTRSTGPSGAT